jgi:hypothetical protein
MKMALFLSSRRRGVLFNHKQRIVLVLEQPPRLLSSDIFLMLQPLRLN